MVYRSILFLRLAVIVAAAFLARELSATEMILKANDRIVFFGDSITHAGDQPGGYIDIFRKSIGDSQSNLNIDVIGAGIGGHKVPDLEARLDRDVLSKKPTHVVIYIGINDVWHFRLDGLKGTPKDQYEAGLNRLIDRIQAANARVILCTPSVVGEKTDGTNELDSMLDEYSAISRKVAAAKSVQMLDLRKAFIENLKTANPQQAKQGILTGDGVHLNPAGNRFVAEQMLAAFGASPIADRTLRHVALFKWKNGTTPDQLKKIENAFADLPNKISEIHDFEWGTDVSTENLAQGYTHCFFVSFQTKADRDAYLPHPAHREFVDLAKPYIEDVLVIDYWTKL